MMHPTVAPHANRFLRLSRHVLFVDIESGGSDGAWGSGVLLTDHLAATAHHVTRGAVRLAVYGSEFDDQRPHLHSHQRGARVSVAWSSEAHDLAILRLERQIDAVPAIYRSVPSVTIGQPVLRLGYDECHLGAGYVHGFERMNGLPRFQASLAAGSGTSGGPLFDFHSGELVGIVTHVFDNEDMPPAAHGAPLRTLFTLLAEQAPDLYRKIIARATR